MSPTWDKTFPRVCAHFGIHNRNGIVLLRFQQRGQLQNRTALIKTEMVIVLADSVNKYNLKIQNKKLDLCQVIGKCLIKQWIGTNLEL